MSPDVDARSFDAPRARRVPTTIVARTLGGEVVTRIFDSLTLTLVVAVKGRCDGCRDFVFSSLDELRGVDVVIVAATELDLEEFADAPREVLVAPEVLAALNIRWPPFYVLIDPRTANVLVEGVVFAPAQVALEIAPYRR